MSMCNFGNKEEVIFKEQTTYNYNSVLTKAIYEPKPSGQICSNSMILI